MKYTTWLPATISVQVSVDASDPQEALKKIIAGQFRVRDVNSSDPTIDHTTNDGCELQDENYNLFYPEI